MAVEDIFNRFAKLASRKSGNPAGFMIAVAALVVWALTGPLFHYSDTWQLIINTGTSVITFLMVFLIQNTQNRDSTAIQIKLDELIRTSTAEDDYVGIESLDDAALIALQERCARAVARQQSIAERAGAIRASRSAQDAKKKW